MPAGKKQQLSLSRVGGWWGSLGSTEDGPVPSLRRRLLQGEESESREWRNGVEVGGGYSGLGSRCGVTDGRGPPQQSRWAALQAT